MTTFFLLLLWLLLASAVSLVHIWSEKRRQYLTFLCISSVRIAADRPYWTKMIDCHILLKICTFHVRCTIQLDTYSPITVTVLTGPKWLFIYQTDLVRVTVAYRDTFLLVPRCQCKKVSLYLINCKCAQMMQLISITASPSRILKSVIVCNMQITVSLNQITFYNKKCQLGIQ